MEQLISLGIEGLPPTSSRLRVWDADSGDLLHTVDLERGLAAGLQPAPGDGPRFAIGNPSGTVHLVGGSTGEPAGTLDLGRFLFDFRYLGDTGTLVAGYSGSAHWAGGPLEDFYNFKVWDIEENEVLRTFGGHRDRLTALEVFPDGRWLATASEDETAKLWDLRDGTCRRTVRGHSIPRCLAFTPDSRRWLTGGDDRRIRVWGIEDTDGDPAVVANAGASVYALAVHPDGDRLAVATADGRLSPRLQVGLTLWTLSEDSLNTPQQRRQAGADRPRHEGWRQAATWNPDGERLLASQGFEALALWEFAASDVEDSGEDE